MVNINFKEKIYYLMLTQILSFYMLIELQRFLIAIFILSRKVI